ncbi:MAG: hypothetical protein SFZ03_10220 [Candidatus Melainabacteria bacterium]|nr:hypothetical protein [Candidatus Melainabacteria bacterium]
MKKPRVGGYARQGGVSIKTLLLLPVKAINIVLQYLPLTLRFLLPGLPLLLMISFFFWPKTPYLRVAYTLHPHTNGRLFQSCTYLGKGGTRYLGDCHCPVVIWIGDQDFK